jgi:hypothetical protein
MPVVSESWFRQRVDSLRWDAEATLSGGLRYGGTGSGRRMVSLAGKNSFIDAVTQGLPRYDAAMLKVYDEAVIVSPEDGKPVHASKKSADYINAEQVALQMRYLKGRTDLTLSLLVASLHR